MKEFLKISALIIALTVALTLTFGVISHSTETAYAESDAIYAYVAPSDLVNSEYAEVSSVPVYPMYGEKIVLFYLIESYYYPVVSVSYTDSILSLDIDGLNVYIEVSDLATTPSKNSAVGKDSALPSSINTVGDIQINGKIVNSAEGWTVKPIGMIDDCFYVHAMKNSENVFGAVKKSSFTSTEIAYHTIAQAERNSLLPSDNDEVVEKAETSSGKSSVALRIILIIGIAIPAVIIAILLFKPRRNERGYDEGREMRQRGDGVDYDRDREYRERDDYDRRRSDSDYDRRDRDYRDRDRDYRDRDYRDRDYRDYRNRDYDYRNDRNDGR